MVNAGLAESPDADVLWRTQGEILRLLGRFDEGLASTDRYLKTSPDDPTALATRAHLLVDAGKADEAAELVANTLGRRLLEFVCPLRRGQGLSPRSTVNPRR